MANIVQYVVGNHLFDAYLSQTFGPGSSDINSSTYQLAGKEGIVLHPF